MPKKPHHKVAIQVDTTNPGEFFACCGLLEMADRLNTGALGWFEGAHFCVAPQDPTDPISVSQIMCSLAKVKVERLSEEKTAPLTLGPPISMRLNWWLLPDEKNKNKLKTWAARQNSLKMLCKWQEPLKNLLAQGRAAPASLFHAKVYEQGPYGFDSYTGWNALSVGFSLNEHNRYKELPTRPAVEMLGAVGLQRFFPDISERNGTTFVTYATWNVPLCPAVARVAALGLLPGIQLVRLEARITRRGSFKGLDTAVLQRGDINA